VTEGAAQPAMVKAEQYILQRLSQAGVKKLFGVPDATCSPMFEAPHSPIDVVPVVTSSDLGAGYAGRRLRPRTRSRRSRGTW
jgi:TPP-dependent 2-oxoacid decarboxylase